MFLSKEDGRLAIAQYTVREAGRFITGTGHMLDPREVGGVVVPHDMVVTSTPEDDPSSAVLHRMVVTDLTWDAVPVTDITGA